MLHSWDDDTECGDPTASGPASPELGPADCTYRVRAEAAPAAPGGRAHRTLPRLAPRYQSGSRRPRPRRSHVPAPRDPSQPSATSVISRESCFPPARLGPPRDVGRLGARGLMTFLSVLRFQTGRIFSPRLDHRDLARLSGRPPAAPAQISLERKVALGGSGSLRP